MTWSTDMSKAPRGRLRIVPAAGNATRKVSERHEIIVASACGIVTVSYWIDDEKRWNMFTRDSGPIAWMPYAGPRHYLDAKGRPRVAIDLPAHPHQVESWFAQHLRDRRAA